MCSRYWCVFNAADVAAVAAAGVDSPLSLDRDASVLHSPAIWHMDEQMSMPVSIAEQEREEKRKAQSKALIKIELWYDQPRGPSGMCLITLLFKHFLLLFSLHLLSIVWLHCRLTVDPAHIFSSCSTKRIIFNIFGIDIRVSQICVARRSDDDNRSAGALLNQVSYATRCAVCLMPQHRSYN